MNKKTKQTYSIRGKLISAACMLLVAVIMVVSSTYAWFTLSTAPEVTGMQTAIGANGALEMALNALEDGPKDGALPADADQSVKNTYWGNLVDVSDGYGLDKITLYPSALNISGNTILAAPLATPEYGADGRVLNGLVTETITGVYNSSSGNFYQGNELGVRAIGAASGMTDRQLSYRNAQSLASTAAAAARTLASQSLNNNGSALANIAIKHGMGGEETYNATDVASLRAIIDDLSKEDGVLDKIETAYMQYILAYAASAATGTDDLVWNAVSGAVNADGATLDSVITAIGEDSLPEAVSAAIEKYEATVADVKEAETALVALEAKVKADAKATFTWDEISTPLTPLANTSAMEINDYKASEVKENLGALVSSVTEKGGLIVTMTTGGGVYADVADQCGDYTASVTIEKVEYNGVTLNNMKARMETKSSVTPSYLSSIATAVSAAKAPESTNTEKMPFTEFYGYILDLAFRTNAAESNLLLQTEAVDRIYEDNTNEDTAGSGSTMIFKSDDPNFTNDQLKALMGNLRVVFFTPATSGTSLGDVLAYAKLDMTKATVTADGIEAPLYLYKDVNKTDDAGNYVAADGTVLYYKVDGVFYAAADCTVAEDGTVTANAGATAVAEADMVGLVAEETFLSGDDAVITALAQNTAKYVSAMVYLDGNSITNQSVSATAVQSMYGKMNLQFSSSANLKPMEYADLHIKDSTTTTTAASSENTPETSTEVGG